MKLKDFQEQVLTTLNAYLEELVVQRERSEKIAAVATADPTLGLEVPDFTSKAWEALRTAGRLPVERDAIPFSPRQDGIGRPVPNVCLKVPTGGGKTLLAASAVSRILDRWQGQRTGFVLWICPNEAIYSQTRKALRDREHPYRHILDQASGGRTKILEKEDPLNAADVESQLCVMLLMLQSANRETKESLRLFRDRGSVHGFFPAADDKAAQERWLKDVPNLDTYHDVTAVQWHVVKDSLGNVLRAIRPLVVLDEGHKGYSTLAMETLYGFNPSFVLELSATPVDRPRDTSPVYSNWLCDVRGVDLANEDMIKLPINVSVRADKDWRACLRQALEKLNALHADAERLHSECARYIRPICLVQVERTGKDQRDGSRVHSLDALDHLLALGLREDEVAIKSAEQDDLKARGQEDLTSTVNPVRFIITKQALQEGWDCPFAYVLCSLAPTSSRNAMTQLIGRVLRQPDAEKTGMAALDECYVLCVHADNKTIIDAIKKGLEQDGMGDLAEQVRQAGDGTGAGNDMTTVRRRKGMEALRIFLPVVHWVEGGQARELDYEIDLLARSDALAIDMAPLAKRLAGGEHEANATTLQISLRHDHALVEVREMDRHHETPAFDPVHVCRAIGDLVPNAWQARELVQRLVAALTESGLERVTLGGNTGLLVDELRKHIAQELDELAETIFRDDLEAGRLQFSLRADATNYMVPDNFEALLAKPYRRLTRDDGHEVEKGLFEPTTDDGINGLERNVACYVDGKAATRWWFRNVARRQYGLQGWRKHRVYPDLIISVSSDKGAERVLVLETKGEHLEGNQDTEYKRALLNLLTEQYRGVVEVGDLDLTLDNERELHCALVLEDDWRVEVPVLMKQ